MQRKKWLPLVAFAALAVASIALFGIAWAKATQSVVELPQSIIDEALRDVSGNPIPAISLARVDVGQYKPGVEVRGSVIVHNGDGIQKRLLKITTEPNEATAEIPIKGRVLDDDVQNILGITSDNPAEILVAKGYRFEKTGLILIDGFLPDATRISEITYIGEVAYKVELYSGDFASENESIPYESLAQWVTIKEPVVVLKPQENAIIPVILKVPEGVNLPKRWEFRIAMYEVESANYHIQKGQLVIRDNVLVNTQIEHLQRWVIEGR